MNAAAHTAPPTLGTPAEIQARIDSERQRLLDEQTQEKQLTDQRLAPLEAGDDAALDRIESKINACRERQFRIQERIEILETRLEESRARDRESELDRIQARAERARDQAEALIRSDYAKLAQQLAALLGRLAALNGVVADANWLLDRAGRRSVENGNRIRCRPREEWQEMVTVRVHVNDPRHPHHGAVVSRNNAEKATLNGQVVDAFAELQELRTFSDSADYPEDLESAIELPGIGPAPRGQSIAELWNSRTRDQAREQSQALAAEIDAELAGRPAKETKRRGAA